MKEKRNRNWISELKVWNLCMIIDANLFRMFCSWRTFFYSSFSPKMSSIFRLSSCMCSIRHPWGKTQDYCLRDLVGLIYTAIHWEPLYIEFENCLLTSYPDSSLRFPLHLLPASLCLGVSLGLVYFFFEDQLAMDHMVLALFKCFCCVILIVKSFVLQHDIILGVIQYIFPSIHRLRWVVQTGPLA